MRVFARLIKHPLDVVIERAQQADVRVHQRSARPLWTFCLTFGNAAM
jgi:hypothetical protein